MIARMAETMRSKMKTRWTLGALASMMAGAAVFGMPEGEKTNIDATTAARRPEIRFSIARPFADRLKN